MADLERTLIVHHEELLRFTVACFRQAGFDDDRSDLIGHSLIEADLRGLNTHGVLRIPMYLNRVKWGLIDVHGEPTVVFEKGNVTVVDGANGMGQVSSSFAMKMAMDKAPSSVTAIVGVRNSNHFGTAAYYTMMAAKHQMVGVCISNTEPLMAVTGGARPAIGTNPLSVAIPARNRPPIVFDMATSAAALGKIMIAKKRGEPIPLGWAIDRQGNDTTSPSEALNGGCLLPVGGPKGYGLSLMIDIFAGILMGSAFGRHVRSPFTDMENPTGFGHMFMALDVESLLPLNEFYSKIEELTRGIKEGVKATGAKEIFLPGEIEHNTKEARLKGGIPLPMELVKDLEALAAELGVGIPKIKPYATNQ